MQELWERIMCWFSSNVPPGFFSPAVGASPEEIHEVESLIGIRLPDDVRESYLLHNGGTNDSSFYKNYYLMSLRDSSETWRMNSDALQKGEFDGLTANPTGPIRPDQWNVGWIPVMTSTEAYLIADMAPLAGGHQGQFIEYWVEQGPRQVLAKNFREWLEKYADDLENGKYYFDEGMITWEEGE